MNVNLYTIDAFTAKKDRLALVSAESRNIKLSKTDRELLRREQRSLERELGLPIA